MQGRPSKNAGSSGLGVLFTGYMEKQNPIRKSYSKRFLVLTHEAFYWFRRPDNTDLFGEERGSISLSAILSVRRKDEYSFDIEDTAHGHRFFRYIAGTGSVAQCDEWITQIRSACKKLKDKIEQSAREKRKQKKGSGSIQQPTAATEGDTETNKEEQKRSVAVRMVTLKNNGIELVMARNPIWERLIRIPFMQEGDVVLISTSNGGIVTLSRSFMLEKAMKSQDMIRDLMLTGEDSSSVHITTPQATAGGGGEGGNIGAEHQSNITAISNSRLQGAAPALGPSVHSNTPGKRPSAGQGGDAKAMDTKDGRGMVSTASSTGVSTSELLPVVSSANAGYFVDVPILNTELPSSLKLSVSWINDEVDSALQDGTYENNASNSTTQYTLFAFCFDVFRQALKDSGDNITLMLALMCTIVGVTSMRAVNSNNSLLFVFCMCLAVSVLHTALLKAKRQVEQDRDPRQKKAELSNGGKDDGYSSIAGAQSFHLVIAGHSFTSPDQPIVQTIESIPERFIRACEGDVEQARRRWETTRHWRETEGVNTILVEHQPHFHHIKNFYPHYNCGYGKEGHVVYYERPGELMPQLKQLHSRGIGTKEMLRHWLYVTEYQFEVLCKGEPLAKGISVIDVKGVGVFDFMGKTLEFVKKSVQVAGQHYPERSFVIYVVNANSIFTTIWSIVKGWIHENTVKKVRILGPSDTLSGLQEHIDISQIPEYYGGGLKYGDDKDGCRFHAPPSEDLYELVRKVNSGEVTSMDEVYAMYDLPNPNASVASAPVSAATDVAPVATSTASAATSAAPPPPPAAAANPPLTNVPGQGRRLSAKQRPSLKFSHSPALKGDTSTPPRRSLNQTDDWHRDGKHRTLPLNNSSFLDQEDSDEGEQATPAQQRRQNQQVHDSPGISPLTMTPATQRSSGLRSRRGRETNESSSISPDRSPYDARRGIAGGFTDSPESRASQGTANSTPARAFSDYYEF